MDKKATLTITESDVQSILTEHYQAFRDIVGTNVFCSKCAKTGINTGIRDYTIKLDDLNNLHLEGFCTECGNPVARYIEYDEDPAIFARAETFRKDNRSRFNLRKV